MRSMRATSAVALTMAVLASLVVVSATWLHVAPPAGAAPATVLVNEPFTGATLTDPLLVGAGATCLTGATASTATMNACPTVQTGPVPARGTTPGYLQLTDAANSKAGAVFYNRPIPATSGIEATFELYQYGGTGADGITFFLVDGATQLTATGGLGGSLGYAQRFGNEPGILGGYVGVGFDVYGNYYDDGEQRGTGCPPGQQSPSTQSGSIAPNTVVIRGPGAGLYGYCYQASTTTGSNPDRPKSTLPASLAGTTLANAKRTADVVISPAPNPTITVKIDFNDGKGFQTVLGPIPAPAGTPQTYKFGFSGSTGGSTDVHLLRNAVVGTVKALGALTLAKQVDRTVALPPVLTAGSTIPYQFVVTNAGAVALHGVTIADTKLVTGAVCPAVTVPPAPAVGSTIVCTGSYVVTAGDVIAGSVTNTATATGLDPGNVAVTSPPDTETVPLTSSLSLTKQATTPGPFVPGGTINYSYSVVNTGGSTISNVAVLDNRIAKVTCPVTVLAPGATVVCTGAYVLAQADMAPDGTVTNTASASGTSPIGQKVASDQAQATVAVGVDLEVTKTVDNAAPVVGDEITYTITLINHGPAAATNIVVSAPLPLGTSSATPPTTSAGTFDPATGRWTVPSLAVGASATLIERDRVDTGSAVVNSATITSRSQPEINPANDSASQTVNPVTPTTDIAVVKDIAPTTVRVGQNAVATVTASNVGPFAATGVTVRDPMPNGIAFVSASGDGSYDPATGVWTIGDLAVGASATVTITVVGTSTGFVINTASLSSVTPPDTNPANDVATANLDVTPPLADLSVGKIARPDNNATVGDSVSFVVTAANNGPDAASGVTVTDVFPAGLTLTETTAERGTYDPATGIWTIGALASGETLRLQLVSTATTVGFMANAVSITDPGVTDPDGSNNSAEAGLRVDPLPPPPVDVGVTKTAVVAAPDADGAAAKGGTVTFTIVAVNTGPNPATGVVFTDQLPDGLDLVSAAPAGQYDATTGAWTVGALAVNAPKTLTIVALVSGPPGTYVNAITLTAVDQTDTNDQNNSASASVQVVAVADLAVTKTVTPATARIGDVVTYTVTITNNGPNDDTGIQLVETSKEEATFVSIVLSQGTFDPATRIWQVGSLAAGAQATINVGVLITRPAVVVNRTVVSSADLPDPDLTNNEASATLEVPGADLAVTKTVDDASPLDGANVTYTVSVHNLGPDSATGVTVDDPVPAPFTFVSASPSAGSYDATTGSWTLDRLDPLDTATLTVVATAHGTATATNTAIVRAVDPPDQDPSNNTAAVAVTPRSSVTPPVPPEPPAPSESADLHLVKTVDTSTAVVGATVTFTLVATNAGPGTASAARITDTLPPGLAPVATSAGCVVAGQIVTCAVGDLAAGQSGTVTVSVRVTAAGSFTNQAIVESPVTDPASADNTASAAVVANEAILPPTGAGRDGLLALALALLGLGGGLIGLGRRTRRIR